MIEVGGTAPYAPAAAVLGVVRAYRDKPVPTPIDTGVIERIDVPASIAPRTLQALKLLDLLDADGNPTPAMQGLRKAESDADYRERLAEVVRAAYAEIFAYRDPATDDREKIEGTFRNFSPHGMRPRMVNLFLGLCAEAGIIEAGVPKVTRTSAANGGKPTAKKTIRERLGTPAPRQTPASKPSLEPGGDHLLVKGLVAALPPVGAEWPDDERVKWTEAALANFNLVYKRPKVSQATEEGGR